MGNSHGRSNAAGAPVAAGPPVGQYSPLPQDTVPYTGVPINYLLADVAVQLSSNFSFGLSAGQQMTTTNIDSYYPMIAQYYQNGYMLETFYAVPGASQTAGFGSVSSTYQMIMSKPGDGSLPGHYWQLRVEKCMLRMHRFFTGAVLSLSGTQGQAADSTDIIDKVSFHASHGARLVCVELTGVVVSAGVQLGANARAYDAGVDVFFNFPNHPNPIMYSYQAVHVPVHVTIQGFPGVPVVSCDWLGQMGAYLNQGWKLVEIFLDKGQSAKRSFTVSCQLNSIWFFEKEAARINDPTPIYEGCAIAYMHEISASFGGTKVRSTYVPVIDTMGKSGWELACILETPEVVHSGIGKMTMKLMLFFQRRRIYPTYPAPPAYQPIPSPQVQEKPPAAEDTGL